MILILILCGLIGIISFFYTTKVNNNVDLLSVDFDKITIEILNIRTPIIVNELFQTRETIVDNFMEIPRLFLYEKILDKIQTKKPSVAYRLIYNDSSEPVKKIVIQNELKELLNIHLLEKMCLIVPYGWTILESDGLEITGYHGILTWIFDCFKFM